MLRLSSLWTSVPLPPEVAELLNETVLAYVYGLPGAATSLARATLERALKNATGQPNLGLSALIEAARRGAFLEEAGGAAATKVKTAADRVLHQGGPNHDEAFEVILGLREALSQLLGGELGPQSRP